METVTKPSDAISVVYIEDDQRIARMMSQYLESHGVVVNIAADGETGIATVLRERPDVILLDLMLPGWMA